MSPISLFMTPGRLGSRSVPLPLLYPALRALRAASLNSAVARGLRRSKGVGFRGKERSQDTTREPEIKNRYPRDGPVRRTADPIFMTGKPQLTKRGWTPESVTHRDGSAFHESKARLLRGKKDISEKEPIAKRSRAARFNDPNSSFGKRSQERKKRKELEITEVDPPSNRREYPSIGRTDISNSYTNNGGKKHLNMPASFGDYGMFSRNPYGDKQGQRNDRPSGFGERRPISDASRRAAESDKIAHQRNPNGTKLSASRLSYLERTSRPKPAKMAEERATVPDKLSRNDRDSGRPAQAWRDDRSWDRPTSGVPSVAQQDHVAPRSVFAHTVDNRLPLSIPYTTPASEFLYGTSVVEAALRARRIPRRKLYKLYVYAGANREHVERDNSLERLAQKKGVDIVNVPTDGIRLLDKMSAGRPHNGYILEASPLPKLPVVSLGNLGEKDGSIGFDVVVDHQSREEAAVNGTDSFIRISRDAHGRRPFVLLLDSILDPGNLGGIIRTASFLGVTAIGISTRNSASFTPVVLKASAGASENVTLFSVAKPSGFVADSKMSGWKVYAAVAPSSNRDSNMPALITTDELRSPLDDSPCILMIGNEGEGLRWNLRSKADVELAIEGNLQKSGVDSLNVSVATGILCNAFLRKSRGLAVQHPLDKKVIEEAIKPMRDLF